MVAVENFYVRLGRRVHARRVELGWTQQELGRRLTPQVTRASIANLEGGKQRVLAHTLVQLSRSLGVGVDVLVQEDATARTSDGLGAELKAKLGLDTASFERLAQDLGLEGRGEE